jgi:hypothetical protein
MARGSHPTTFGDSLHLKIPIFKQANRGRIDILANAWLKSVIPLEEEDSPKKESQKQLLSLCWKLY